MFIFVDKHYYVTCNKIKEWLSPFEQSIAISRDRKWDGTISRAIVFVRFPAPFDEWHAFAILDADSSSALLFQAAATAGNRNCRFPFDLKSAVCPATTHAGLHNEPVAGLPAGCEWNSGRKRTFIFATREVVIHSFIVLAIKVDWGTVGSAFEGCCCSLEQRCFRLNFLCGGG